MYYEQVIEVHWRTIEGLLWNVESLSLSPNGTNQVQLKGDSGGPCIHAVSGGGLRLAGVQSWVSWNGGGVNKSYQTSVSIIRDWVAQVTMQHDVEIAHSGKCLRVASYSKSNFALVEQRTCNNGGSQRWRLVPVPLGWYPGGYSEVYQIVNVNSGRCLDVRDGKTTNGAVVQQYGCHGGTNQMWTLKRIGSSDRWEVHSVKGGKCLDVTNFSKADGAKLQMWSCHGGKNQQFRFRGFLAGGFEYELAQAKAPGTCADVQGWSKGNMADVQTYSCHEGANQRWSHAMVSGNAHRLRNVNSYKCLDVANFSKSSGANVQQYACHAGANQKWDFYYTGKGYHIKNRHSGKCLQPVGGSVKQAWCYTTSTQRWRPRF